MTPDQLPDSLELRNRLRSLATLDLLVATPPPPSITFAPTAEPHTQIATLHSDDRTVWNFLFTPEGATLTLDGTEITLASTLDQPIWQSSESTLHLPDLLDGTPESAQAWLNTRYGKRPDLIPIRQILMSVPLTVDLARELGNNLSWADLREAVSRIGYPIPDEDMAGPDDPNAGANLD